MGKYDSLRQLSQRATQSLEDAGIQVAPDAVTVDEILQGAAAPEVDMVVADVVPAPWKLYYDEAKVESLMESIRVIGQIDPVVVIPAQDGKVTAIAGLSRREAIRRLGDRLIRVKLLNLTEAQALDIAAASNAQRGDPNPLELIHLILESLSLKLERPQGEVIQLFRRLGNDKNNVVLTPEWAIVEETFKAVCRFSPETFRVHYLPILNLPAPILEAMKQGKLLDHTKARAIAKLKGDSVAMEALLQEVIANPDVSVRDIGERIKGGSGDSKKMVEPWGRVAAVQRQIKQQQKRLREPDVQRRMERAIQAFELQIQEILGGADDSNT